MKPLTIESFRSKAFKFYINRGVVAFTMQNLTKGKLRFDFNVHLESIGKDLQRRFVWSNFQKQQFVDHNRCYQGTHDVDKLGEY